MSDLPHPDDKALDRLINDAGVCQLYACNVLWGDPGDPDTYPADAPWPWEIAWVKWRAREMFAGWWG